MAVSFSLYLNQTLPNAQPTSNAKPISSSRLQNPKALLNQCKTIRDLQQVHTTIIKTHSHDPPLFENFLELCSFSLNNGFPYAQLVFSRAENLRASSYNIMIRAYTSRRAPREALSVFKEMCEKDIQPDEYTFPCILKACSQACALREGMAVHAQILKNGESSNAFVRNTLVHMYGKCGDLTVARKLFDEMTDRSIIAWNSMFAVYSKSGKSKEVVRLFQSMREDRVRPDEVTMICVLTACGRLGALELGKWIHGYLMENGFLLSRNLMTAIVDMYAKCGLLDIARNVFDEMPKKDVVAWSAMISGYNQASRCKEALALFREMQVTEVQPNEVTMVSVLSSCAVLGALEAGKWVHYYVDKKKLKMTVTLGTALVDFYAKCGSIDKAMEVFNEMPERNVLSWTVMIQGLASNGQGTRALALFSQMIDEKIEPNDVTFIGVLSACSHAGLVEEGRRYFNAMTVEYGIMPVIDHYGCMVDILARAGLIDEAHQFIKCMPIEPNAIIWRTLLASCRVHGNVEIAEDSLRRLNRIDPDHSGDYILLSNVYASVGRWEDALRVRSEMKKRGIKKTPGCTLIEVDGVIHEFFAEDSSHPLAKDIYAKVGDMIEKIKLVGYVPNTAEARLDADEEEKEVSVSHHSEKLAIAFGLIRTPPGTTIRISKNLRVCTDCHTATKIISKVFDREIVVRDRNRFHHFRGGSCSCNDFW
ncbi:pentatricopeptide repeat-containing protein At1g08070, chloroplastic [Amborella trichopoda]|uniref:pentatricopeptide repeat-containing protein At1g08070, chloroplastic n=1 Tax=Amborella trichopoda TaxID=13333 RepID=UPI0005D36117|nr:pentatricopeptide repeat-containing protein At1g08070, chloroplastic [Amborella trichopoda]|eukprot:XP_011626248.1 pentatricopeptide repeat-containing protein At1g08070, chloroplastic [Amborella trichopoda]